MLLKVHLNDPSNPSSRRLENMHVTYFPNMTLFLTSLQINAAGSGTITVTHSTPGQNAGMAREILIPIQPETSKLGRIDIIMHQSPTKAYEMPTVFNEWFSACFGFEVILAYLGENLRPVLGTFSPNAIKPQGWLSTITSKIWPIARVEDGITFADCAPFLIVTESSLADVSARLPAGEVIDVTKFRPNIVLQGSPNAFDEDFWREIKVRDDVDLILTHNCVRCKSINIDYATGRPGTGESGKILKKLMKDRRVDAGTKYSPVFGRYAFLGSGAGGKSIGIGDDVTITARIKERTTYGEKSNILRLAKAKELDTDWPGLTN